jgi:hypothetical protein
MNSWKSSAWIDGATLFARRLTLGGWISNVGNPLNPHVHLVYQWPGDDQVALPIDFEGLIGAPPHFPYGYVVAPD